MEIKEKETGNTQLQKLKDAKTLGDVAQLLGFSPQMMAFVLYKIPNKKKYRCFEIPKKTGDFRIINAPEARLKNLQRRLANVLNSAVTEIEGAKKLKSLAHGFKPGFSIHTNAGVHRNSRYVLNFDIDNFFPSINFGRVRGYFIKNNDFLLTEEVATIITQIACHANQLPQGSPCSPVISNLIAHILDVRLVGLAKKYSCKYSRYADDITFSTNQQEFPTDLLQPEINNPDKLVLGSLLEKHVSNAGFKINPAKTRLQSKDRRQLVTGLVVNKKVNVKREYYKLARAMTHNFFTTGTYTIPTQLSPLHGCGDEPAQITETNSARLEGVLNHIYYTRNLTDNLSSSKKQKNATPSAIKSLYKGFLFFKYFGASDKPLIICEGPTDIIHLKLALKKLHHNYPNLIETNGGNFHFKIKFLNFSTNVKDVLGFNGGTGTIPEFLNKYDANAKKFKIWDPKNPVIVMIDNDKGAREIFNIVKEPFARESGQDPKNLKLKDFLAHNDGCYPLFNNLYLVKTPHIEGKIKTCIESFHDKKLFETQINGKTFDLKNGADTDKFYGKRYFAEKVIAKDFQNINFDGFIPLLNRLASACANTAET